MKFLVIGLGSMGKRRIRCLKELGYEDIIGLDSNEFRTIEVDIQAFTKLSFAMKEKPDVFLVCTPPDHHFEYMDYAIRYNIPCFVEASVCIDGLKELVNKDINHLIHPSATMRFNPSIKSIKYWQEKTKDCKAFRYSCKSWLPAWHPKGKDDYYAFEKEVNGCKEMIPFELCWIVDIFGRIKEYSCINWSSGLFGDFYDYYVIVLKFDSGLEGIIEIDVISKECGGGERMFTLIREKDTHRHPIYSNEDMYINELKHFIESLETKQYHYTLKEDIKILKLLEEIEK